MDSETPHSQPCWEPEKTERLFEDLAVLADTLVAGVEVIDLADQLVHSCIEVLGVDAAGILIDNQRGSLGVLASSSDISRLLELFEVQNDEGPCLDAFHSGQPVVSEVLEDDATRWPLFVPRALEDGFKSAYAFPLRLRDRVVGGLNIFGYEPRALATGDLKVAQLLAEQLQSALNSRIVIEQAKGVVAERQGLSMGQAFEELRRAARSQQLPLTEVATRVTEGEAIEGGGTAKPVNLGQRSRGGVAGRVEPG